MRNFILSALFGSAILALPSMSICGELFPSGEVRPYQKLDYLESDATAGGYPIFQGGRPWRIIAAKAVRNNMGVGIGYAHFFSSLRNDYFAEMLLTTSLGGGTGLHTGYFMGDPCGVAVQALVKTSKASGQSNNCLTIKPFTATISNKPIPTMEVNVMNSQSSARLYEIRLLLALDKLGFPDATEAEWSTSSLDNDVKKKQLIVQLTAWAMQLQDNVNLAIGFNKPQDAFQRVPPIDSLLPTLEQPSVGSSNQATTLQRPKPARNPGTTYVYCESMKKMVSEDGAACPPIN